MRFLREHRPGACAAVGGLVVAVVVLTSGVAVADESATTPDPTTTTTTTPAPTSPSTDPTTTDATTTDPTTTDPTTTDPTAPGPTTTDPTTTDPVAPDPTTTVQQHANVDTSQTGVANTGANTTVGDAVSPPPTDAGGGASSIAASVATGSSTAVGGDTRDSITQQATAVATQAAHIVITQLALIVNIGLAVANSGTNAADAGAGGPGVSLVSTGNAAVTGLGGSTAVTQVVNLLDAPEHTTQTATVTNVGVGVGNTGANLAVGQVSGVTPDGTAVAVSWGPPDASTVGTGAATAIGAATSTTIVQVAMGTAADDGSLQITQRAVVVNFGAALANTGLDAAGGSSGSDTAALLVRGIVLALLAMLQPDAPTTIVSGSAAASLAADGSATVKTGSAVAVGNSSTTGILQRASGTVTGNHSAVADQTATVGNFGFAFANTGANTAGSGLPAAEQAQLASIPAAFDGFLALLAAPGDQATWSNDVQLGMGLLAAEASVSAVQALFDLPGTDGSPMAQVVVRQITGILNLMVSVAVSGDNHVSTTVDAASARAAGATVHENAGGTARAVLHTGDAHVANLQTTTICQVINASPSVCLPPAPNGPPTPVTPVVAAENVAAASATVAPAAATSGQLAFTGSSSLGALAMAGLVALLLGVLLVLGARSRRVFHR